MNFNFEKRRNASALNRQQREVPREGDKGELDQEGEGSAELIAHT